MEENKMPEYQVQPWPSTYKDIGKVEPTHLTSRFGGREIGAMRVAIPARTIEPPQIHLIAPRDEKPFEELLTDFRLPFHVATFNARTGGVSLREYAPGEEIVIPLYVAHWLMNPNDTDLEFTCEYAPHPWDGKKDEPEFPDLRSLLAFVDRKGLRQKLIDASRKR